MSAGGPLAAEICLRDAWPAPESLDLGGWRLRAGVGGYNRANSVWTGQFTGEISVNNAIDQVEAFYRQRNLPARFQVLPNGEPAGLDRLLEERGYRAQHDCLLLSKPATGGTPLLETALTVDPTREWLDVYVPEQRPPKATEVPSILARLTVPHRFIVARKDGFAIAVALAGRVGNDVAVDCVQTASSKVRSGGATAVMQAAETWAAGEGARRLVLYVIADNYPARALYDKLGYRQLSTYHYRVKPVAP